MAQTKGDANSIADEPIEVSSIRGAVVFDVPKAGAIVRILKTPAGIAGVLAAAILLKELSWRTERRKDEEEMGQLREEIRKLKQERGERRL